MPGPRHQVVRTDGHHSEDVHQQAQHVAEVDLEPVVRESGRSWKDMTVILIALSVDQPGAQVVVTGVVRQIEGARADGVSIIDGSW